MPKKNRYYMTLSFRVRTTVTFSAVDYEEALRIADDIGESAMNKKNTINHELDTVDEYHVSGITPVGE